MLWQWVQAGVLVNSCWNLRSLNSRWGFEGASRKFLEGNELESDRGGSRKRCENKEEASLPQTGSGVWKTSCQACASAPSPQIVIQLVYFIWFCFLKMWAPVAQASSKLPCSPGWPASHGLHHHASSCNLVKANRESWRKGSVVKWFTALVEDWSSGPSIHLCISQLPISPEEQTICS